MQLGNIDSPRCRTVSTFEDSFQVSQWRKDQSVVEGLIQDSVLNSQTFNLVLLSDLAHGLVKPRMIEVAYFVNGRQVD